MPYYPRRKGMRKSRKPSYRKKTSYLKPKKNFVKAVKAIIHRQIENKITNDYGANQTLAYAGSATNPTFINLCPIPSQGAIQGTRLGNEINVVRATIRGRVNLLPYNAISNVTYAPVAVKMWLCQRKSSNRLVSGAPTSTDFGTFFQLGSGSAGFQGNILDILFSPNKDYWNVFAQKTYTLNNAYISTGGTGVVTSTNAPMSMPFTFSFAKHLGKLKYNDSSSYATNKELYLVFQTVALDGTTIISSQNMAEVHWETQWLFEDA